MNRIAFVWLIVKSHEICEHFDRKEKNYSNFAEEDETTKLNLILLPILYHLFWFDP